MFTCSMYGGAQEQSLYELLLRKNMIADLVPEIRKEGFQFLVDLVPEIRNQGFHFLVDIVIQFLNLEMMDSNLGVLGHREPREHPPPDALAREGLGGEIGLICIYIYIYICFIVYLYIYIYIERERERHT